MFFFEPLQPSHDSIRHYSIQQKHQLNHANEANHPDLSHIYYDENEIFHIKCNVAGYKINELNVHFENGDLIVNGCHKDHQSLETLEKTLKRRIRLPVELDPNKVLCELDGEILEVTILKIEN